MSEHFSIARQAIESIIQHPGSLDGEADPLIRQAAVLSLGGAGTKIERNQRLASIFDRVSIKGDFQPASPNFVRLSPLTLKDQVIFPHAGDEVENVEAAKKRLMEKLDELINKRDKDPETDIEALLEGLKNYGWCIPVAEDDGIADISLYNYARVTAALAVCLKARPDDQGDVALLVGGDISGIQSFIYTITSKRAAKTLRGRSFYLQLLTEAILRFVLRRLGLPSTNVIYSGGGHFFLLAPVGSEKKLKAVQKAITETLLQHHGSSIYFALGYESVPEAGFEAGKFPTYWDTMHRNLAIQKQQRYTELGDAMHGALFVPAPHGGNQENSCAVCGDEREDVESVDDVKVCTLCRSFADDLGTKLADAEFIALGIDRETPSSPGSYENVLAAFGMQVAWPDNREIAFSQQVDRAVIWQLKEADSKPGLPGVPVVFLRQFIVGLLPRVKDRQQADLINSRLSGQDQEDEVAVPGLPMTFSHLQALSTGISRLGVLRADVDGLGEIFKFGFGRRNSSKATLTRLAALSFSMSLFFEGWIKRICEQERFDNRIYAVYAGGDDLFLIGPWDLIPRLGFKIVEEFSRYTGQHPDFHLSAGVAIIKGNYPVYQAAEDASVEERKAKDQPNKNSFSYLGQTWDWSTFKAVEEKKKLLLGMIVKDKASASILRRLQVLSHQEAQYVQNLKRRIVDRPPEEKKKLLSRPYYGPWIWLGVYFLKRLEGQIKNEEVQKEIRNIREGLAKDAFSTISEWGTAARWAELERRGG